LIALAGGGDLAALSIRNLDDEVKRRLRIRAARKGRSMESEIRAILAEAVAEPDDDATNPFVTFMERFQEIGGVELDLAPRSTPARWAEFS